jgi:hypothetical protein
MLTAYKFRLYPKPSDRGEYKPVENPLTAELAKMKIKARSTSHDPKKQEPFQQRIVAEAHTL